MKDEPHGRKTDSSTPPPYKSIAVKLAEERAVLLRETQEALAKVFRKHKDLFDWIFVGAETNKLRYYIVLAKDTAENRARAFDLLDRYEADKGTKTRVAFHFIPNRSSAPAHATALQLT